MIGIFRSVALLLVLMGVALVAHGQEEIRQFKVGIDVQQNGDIIVTETIVVNVEGNQIRRGIFRDLPAYKLDDKTGGKLPYRYSIMSVRRDDNREMFERETIDNAMRIRIGDADRLLEQREHRYEIKYRVKNEVRYFDSYDELYWNVTGSYWNFPIDRAEAIVTLPEGASVTNTNGFTGGQGETARNYQYRRVMDAHVFETTQPLGIREGLTISVSMPKGVIDPPSASDKGWLWWARNGALTVLGFSFLGLLGFYYRSFDRVGRDPAKGPVFPQYEPPEGYSPAAAHHIYNRGFSGHDALVASLMQLGVGGYLDIDIDDNTFKKDVTTLTLKGLPQQPSKDQGDAVSLAKALFGGRRDWKGKVVLDGKPNTSFFTKYTKFRKRISDRYGSPYFKWNLGYVVAGGLATLAAIVFAVTQASYWTGWHTLVIVALIGLNLLFMYLMPAPTRKGQDVRTHIEGFRLYMEKAEKLQLNAVEVGSEAPPPMTTDRYEKFLPFAVALGVEKPWTKHFEKLIPDEAANYRPGWGNVSGRSFGSIGGMTQGITSGISSGVASAAPQSSSSSGGGGGGFSGGGGGGGGGGGW
jgi:uncharacterized membrane protein YgcG